MNIQNLTETLIQLLRHAHLTYIKDRLKEDELKVYQELSNSPNTNIKELRNILSKNKDADIRDVLYVEEKLKETENKLDDLAKDMGFYDEDNADYDLTLSPWNNYAASTIALSRTLGSKTIDEAGNFDKLVGYNTILNKLKDELNNLMPFTFELKDKVKIEEVKFQGKFVNKVVKDLADLYIRNITTTLGDEVMFYRLCFAWHYLKTRGVNKFNRHMKALITLVKSENRDFLHNILRQNLIAYLYESMQKDRTFEEDLILNYIPEKESVQEIENLIEAVYPMETLSKNSPIIKIMKGIDKIGDNIEDIVDEEEKVDEETASLLRQINGEIALDSRGEEKKCEIVKEDKKLSPRKQKSSPRKQKSGPKKQVSTGHCQAYNKSNGKRCANKASYGRFCYRHK